MFQINGDNIILSLGDTASFDVSATGYEFASNDRALFTVKASDGRIVYQKAYALEDGVFRVEFHNEDTDSLTPGSYSYDVRYIMNPVYNDGKIVDGDQVITPKTASTITLLSVVGEV